MTKNLYTKALSLSVSGYSIIPLKKDKRPLLAKWGSFEKEAASDTIIEAWWKKNPGANIGIVTGKISGITVVDIDTHDKENTVDFAIFPPTHTVRTPSGGYHLYYIYDPDIKQTANTYPQFPHVDIRNDGGYVVGAGSVTKYIDKKGLEAGGEYVLVDKRAPVAFPRELFLTKEKKTSTRSKTLLNKIADVQKLDDGDGRNTAMCSLLGSLLRGQSQKNYPVVKETFYSIAASVANPLPKAELETIWNSIGGRAFAEAHTIQFECTAKGEPYANLENIRKILTEDPEFVDRCVFDTFLQVYLYRGGNGVTQYRDLHDSDEITLTREISLKYKHFAMIDPSKVRMVLMEVAHERAVDSAKDWLMGIVWDKVARLDSWLSATYNVADNEYHKKVGSNWLKGMARRIVEPGCKFDYVLVLEGPQGTKKSSSLGILGGAWHVETTATPDNKDFLMLMQGNLIIEFSEGETLSRGEIKQLKALITTQYDKYRAPYERNIQTHPRRCVFAMTTNQTEYLKDETGNRRWLPVATIGQANLEWLQANRDQLMAEALYRVSILKETTYEFSAEMLEEQALRQVGDPNEDRIVEWYYTVLTDDQRYLGVTAHMAFTGALGMMGGRFAKRDQMEITNVFKNILKLDSKRAMIEGIRVMRWCEKGLSENKDVLTKTEKEIEMAF